ncbi:FAD-dependent oxidoreductase [Roseibacillus persicicus]|uniref:FAD-dependent oxidoreductase n=1 Tax=Roseibacillus persicicus TaxID=454148 RepID=UPI00280FA6C8|nr:FAD-dependent oxidoreductase [Roseibacillus persicicus]MDQ8192294.1 FAD-dependent oxidoreductase [Roseibacillus persicicus]
MIHQDASSEVRETKLETISCDFVVIGGGLAGTCAAISAARQGIQVTLVQDRPVLGGNASSEVRLWSLGATSHMGNNNRFSREGGLVDEILVENTFRNKEGNVLIFDTILLEKVKNEPNIRLLLNTAAHTVEKSDPNTISRVHAFCSQNSTRYTLEAPLFCDASGDGIAAFQAGAAFRMGAEDGSEFDEGFAPDDSYGELLGHTIYFYSKDLGKPVSYTAPEFALKDITQLPRFRNIDVHDHGCKFWWLEYGGRRDTVHETEEIKWELWKVVYGVWDYIKNSGKFPEAETMTLEWVGTIPGKRESRRFEGDYMISQKDVIDQIEHHDAISAGGWSLDLHPADAVYSEQPGCNQWHSKGVYGLPYRCHYSRNVSNLFLAGRIISSSHVAFGSTRVILTCGHGGVAVGAAAAQCIHENKKPADLLEPSSLKTLQNTLNITGQSIPGIPIEDSSDLVQKAQLSASSTLALTVIPANDQWLPLEYPVAQLLPFQADTKVKVTATIHAKKNASIKVALRTAEKPCNYTPDLTLEEFEHAVTAGTQTITTEFTQTLGEAKYAFLCYYGDPDIEIQTSAVLATGLVSVQKKFNKAVSNDGEQIPPEGIGIDRFEFWVPNRRPAGQNLALRLDPALPAYSLEHLKNGYTKPWIESNAWAADLSDEKPQIDLAWESPQTISNITLYFDTDYDHAMETSQWGHPENLMPHCVRSYRILDEHGTVLHSCEANHQTINRIALDSPVTTSKLTLEIDHPSATVPAALFKISCH